MARSLPSHANIRQLRTQAKELVVAFRANEHSTVERVRRYLNVDQLGLRQAQYVLAREYGCRTWAALRESVSTLEGADAMADEGTGSSAPQVVDGRVEDLTLHCRNYDECVHFYKDLLGLPLLARTHGSPHHEMSWREPYFHFALFPAEGDSARAGASFTFRTSDVPGMHARLVSSGVQVVESPEQKPWGLIASYQDPDGNVVGLYDGGGG